MTIKKTMHELAKEFPEKTYRELEKYRNADRQEEAQQIITQQDNEELKEDQLTESQRRQMELEPIEEDSLHQSIHIEIWKARYEKEYKLRQEAIELFNQCHAKALELEEELKQLKKKTDPVHTIKKARESGL
jgi:FMN phosphatase YigB (HAD superfamily)